MSRRRRFTRNLGRTLPEPLPQRLPTRYVRFEHAARHAHGPFCHASVARQRLSAEDRAALELVLAWFEEHLEEPSRMVPFRYVGERRARRRRRWPFARCWFREDAVEHVAKARELAALLTRAGIPIVERRSARVPGKLCAEDEHQIAVVPFRDSRAFTT